MTVFLFVFISQFLRFNSGLNSVIFVRFVTFVDVRGEPFDFWGVDGGFEGKKLSAGEGQKKKLIQQWLDTIT